MLKYFKQIPEMQAQIDAQNKRIAELEEQLEGKKAELEFEKSIARNATNFSEVSKDFKIGDIPSEVMDSVVHDLKPLLKDHVSKLLIDISKNVKHDRERFGGYANASVAYDTASQVHEMNIDIPAVSTRVRFFMPQWV